MVVGLGTDITEVPRVARSIERFGDRFLERVYTPGEITYCLARKKSAAQSFAARFAAKEAAFKALRTGWRGGLSWHHVEVTSTEAGAPLLQLSGYARTLFDAMGATHAHLSLSHTSEHAVAQVIFERRT